MKRTILKLVTFLVFVLLGINYTLDASLKSMSYPASENAYEVRTQATGNPLAAGPETAKSKKAML